MASLLVIIGFIFGVVELYLNIKSAKNEEKISNKKQVSKWQEVQKPKKVKKQNFNKTNRVIVDREQEIYNKNITVSKETIVDDIIFAEILSKPKSKR